MGTQVPGRARAAEVEFLTEEHRKGQRTGDADGHADKEVERVIQIEVEIRIREEVNVVLKPDEFQRNRGP